MLRRHNPSGKRAAAGVDPPRTAGVPRATETISTGYKVTVDGAASGVVTLPMSGGNETDRLHRSAGCQDGGMAERKPILRNRSFWAPFLVGVALMAGIDEIVFHQLLAWHHFYDNATPAVGLLSDGLLHATELFMLIAGFFLIADTVRRGAFWPGAAWAGLVAGMGVFQLFDGIVDHKVLRVHQVRYDVADLLPYDLAWNASGLALLVLGSLLAWSAARRAAPATRRRDR